MVIDHSTGVVYTNDSLPIIVGRVYRLMGNGDDYVTVVSVSDRYVVIRGLEGVVLEAVILKSAFDNIIKELMPEADDGLVDGLLSEDGFYLVTEDGIFIVW